MLRAVRLLAVFIVVATVVLGDPLAASAQVAPSPAVSVIEPEREGASSSGAIERFMGSSGGDVPLDHYDIGYRDGGITDWRSKVLGLGIELAFTALRWFSQLCISMLRWAFSFEVAEALTAPAGDVANNYQESVLGSSGMGLGRVFWFCAIALSAWHLMKGRVAKGAGELFVTVVIGAIAIVFLTAPSTTLLGPDGALAQSRDVATAIAGATTTSGNPASTDGIDSITDTFRETFIEHPHQIIQWGTVLDGDPTKVRCLATYDELVATGPHGTDRKPRDKMVDAGCESEANFNAKPSTDRLFMAIGVFVLVVLASAQSAVVAVILIGVSIAMAFLVMLAPFAFAFGIVPGAGRLVLIRWLAWVLKALFAVISAVVFLALSAVTIKALYAATAGQPAVLRLIVLDTVSLFSFGLLVFLRKSGHAAAEQVSKSLERARIGGTDGSSWLRPRAINYAKGFAVGGMVSQNREDLVRARRIAQSTSSKVLGKGWSRGARLGDPSSVVAAVASTKPAKASKVAAKVAGKGAKVAFASTVGAPVYGPKVAKAAHATVTSRARAARRRTASKASGARHFGEEYVQNVRAAAATPRTFVRSARSSSRSVDGDGPSTTPTNGEPKRPPRRQGRVVRS